MSPTESSIRTVFRVCVVNAVRRGEALMGELFKVSEAALTQQESSKRDPHQRLQWSEALRQLRTHEAALLKAYPMALLEIFAEGPATAKPRPADATGMDFGELSIMDDAEMQAQMEFSRAQQLAAHVTDAALAELNALVSAAQGLRSVQPERNPLRPECYIRALQRVVGDTGVPGEVRQIWMRAMQEPLGGLLVEEYKCAAQALRDQGVQPVGYAVLGTPGLARDGLQGGGYAQSSLHGGGYATGYGGLAGDYAASGYSHSGATTGWGGPHQAAEAEEALLTVGILRQMLAAEPIDPRVAGVSAQGALASGYFAPGAAAEALQDMAQLERLVGRLSQPNGPAAPQTGWRGPAVALDAGAAAEEVVSRMVAHIVQDARLLPSVQRAVANLEPALQQLVRRDPRFFDDDTHPARRLLDEVTERSRAFTSEGVPGFSRFMRLVNEAVVHLSGQNIQDATPFASVLVALEAAWSTQAQNERAQREAKERALRLVEQRAMLAAKIAADIRKLPGADLVPADMLDFATGPWAEVVALAQVNAVDPAAEGGDPGGYLALVPELLWSLQPAQVGSDTQRLSAVLPGLQATLRRGLESVGCSETQIQAFLTRLEMLHGEVFAAALGAAAEPAQSSQGEAPAVEIDLPADGPVLAEAADPHPEFRIGIWVEITSQRGKPVCTQLTWTSPHKTLFLFTGQDKSTQSMTRRVRDKLMAEGSLRVLPEAPPPLPRRSAGRRPHSAG